MDKHLNSQTETMESELPTYEFGMLLKRGMGNGEWGMGNGEWGMGNGEWEIENRKFENGKFKMKNW